MPKISIDPYDVSSVEAAIAKLDAYQRDLENKIKSLIEALVARGVTIAKTEVAPLSKTGILSDSIEGFYDNATHVGIIRTDCEYAVYVEYGTGVVGAGSPHPDPDPGWAYDINGHGDAGWVYYNDRQGGFWWTKGQPSHPFMYNTRQQLEYECESIAKGVFGIT